MRIAVIAHDFPPINIGGSQRPYFLLKALKDAGIDATIFTLNINEYPDDKCNFRIVESTLKIIRTPIKPKKNDLFSKGNYFTLTDNVASRWMPYLEKALNNEHKIAPFDYLFITCPPFSLAAQAQKLSKNIGIPYILDFRDAWSQWIMTPFPTYFHYRRLLQIEKKVIQNAIFISSTSNQQIDDFVHIHGKELRPKFIYAPNGFHEYRGINNSNSKTEKIRIIYTGSFYFNPYSQSLQSKKWYQKKWYQWLQYLPREEDWTYRSPLFFFKALEKLILEDKQLSLKIEVIFAGQKPVWFDQMVNECSLQENVKHVGFLNKEEVQFLLEGANFLLITSSKIPGGKEYSVAGKTFEYIAHQKPILAFVCEGEQMNVLNETGLAYIFNPDSITENASSLKSILEKNPILAINQEGCAQYKIPNNYSQLISNLKNAHRNQ